MSRWIFFVFAAFMAVTAYSQTATPAPAATSYLDKGLALALAILAICRVVAEVLTKLAVAFESPEMTKLGKLANDGAWYVGKLIGFFGAGTPTEVKKDIQSK